MNHVVRLIMGAVLLRYLNKVFIGVHNAAYQMGYFDGRRDQTALDMLGWSAEPELSPDELTQVLAQQIIQNPYLKDSDWEWDGIDRIALYGA